MTDWTDRVHNHAVHKTLLSLSDALSAAESKAAEVEGAPDSLTRLKHVAALIKRRLARVDDLLVGTGALDPLNATLAQVLEQVNQFAATGNAAHLNNANAHADKLLPTVATLVVPDSTEDVEALRSAMEDFHGAAKERMAGLREESEKGRSVVQSLQADVQKLQQTIKDERARIDEAVTQHQRQFSEAQESRQKTFTDAEKTRTDAAQTQVTSWDDRLSELKENHQNEFRQLVTTAAKEQKDAREAADKSVAELLEDIEARRDKAKEIVGIIAGTGMAGGYQKDADEQRKSFYIWNVGTVIGFVGLIGFAVWLFVASARDVEFGWPQITARLVAIVAFGLFAAYAGRMAMKHRESERQHRHKQLALESINAFLEDLEPGVQKEVKQKMAEVFFTQPQGLLRSEEDVAPTTIDALLKLVGKAIDKLGR